MDSINRVELEISHLCCQGRDYEDKVLKLSGRTVAEVLNQVRELACTLEPAELGHPHYISDMLTCACPNGDGFTIAIGMAMSDGLPPENEEEHAEMVWGLSLWNPDADEGDGMEEFEPCASKEAAINEFLEDIYPKPTPWSCLDLQPEDADAEEETNPT